MIANAKLVAIDYDPSLYHKDTGMARGDAKYPMGRSDLVSFTSCPRKWLDGFQREDSDATDWGTLIDCLVLTPQMFDGKMVVKPAQYKDEKTGTMKDWHGGATFCKEWAKEHEGLKLVSDDDWNESQKAIARLKKDPAIEDYLACSDKQVYCTAEWHDPGTGIVVPLKTLIDLVPLKSHATYGKTLGDFKTSRDASLETWRKEVRKYGYDVQAALELDIYNLATKEERNDFRHVIQENVEPYQTAKRIVDAEFLTMGRDRYRMALAWYCECLKSGDWPDYDKNAEGIGGWAFVKPKAWMVKDE